MPYNTKEKRNAYMKEYTLKNKDKLKEYNKKYHGALKLSRLKCTYGITEEDYHNMLLKQEDKCLICNRHRLEFKRRLSVDHDHTTGKVRGLLCSNCNRGLGYFKDSEEILNKAIKYLKVNNENTAT